MFKLTANWGLLLVLQKRFTEAATFPASLS